MSTISIVTPAYNAQNTIGETIESVLAQTYRDFELIVVNDGSQDRTVAVVQGYDDPRIRLCSYPNAGVAASRNRGIEQARGEFIASLDADDLWRPDKLAVQLAALRDRPDAAAAYSWSDCIDERSRFLRHGGHRTLSGAVLPYFLLSDITENGSNILIRRAALETVGGFDESLTAGQDWDLYIRLAARFPFVAVPVVHVLYRIVTGSVSANLSRFEVNCRRVIDKAFAIAPEPLQPLRARSLGNLYKYLTYRALQKQPAPANAREAARYFRLALANDPSLLKARVSARILARLALTAAVPTGWQPAPLRTARAFTDFNALLGYIDTEI